MARIVGVNLPKEKRIEIAMTYIHGIGRSTSIKVLDEAKVDLNTRVKDLTSGEEQAIRDALSDCVLEADLQREHQLAIKHMMEVGSYRGSRHAKRLPVRGQNTKTNARTKRGKKATGGSGRRTDAKK